jgi:hypothetical protein
VDADFMGLSIKTWWPLLPALVLLAAAIRFILARRETPVWLLAAAALMLLAAARPAWRAAPPATLHAVVLDVSPSMQGRLAQIRPWLEDELGRVNLPRGHGFVLQELSDALRIPGSPAGDELRPALLVSAAHVTGGGELVLVTDGRMDATALFGAVGASRLLLVRPPAPELADAAILAMSAPARATEGSAVVVGATLYADADAEVPWRLEVGEDTIATGTVAVRSGIEQAWRQVIRLSDEGLQRVTLRLEHPADREPRNDVSSVAVRVGQRTRVLYVTPSDADPATDWLRLRLESDPSLQVVEAQRLPDEVTGYAGWDAVVVNDVPAGSSDARSLTALADWVRGGGRLLMAGAEGAFGPGGYRSTPVEDVLPVRLRPEDARPRLYLLLLDVSASMGESLPGGDTRLAVMQRAALAALEALSPADAVAIVPFSNGLDAEPTFRTAADRSHHMGIAALRAGGSTHIGRALRQAAEALPERGEAHVLLVTDGENLDGTDAGGFAEIGRTLTARQARLDVVLTHSEDPEWFAWLRTGGAPLQIWRSDYGGLTRALASAARGADREWVLRAPLAVEGVPLPLSLLVRTAPRDEAGVRLMLAAQDGAEGRWPLLAARWLTGRSVALCTATRGDSAQAAFLQAPEFAARMDEALAHLLDGLPADFWRWVPGMDRPQLVWVGPGDPPGGMSVDGPVTMVHSGEGRWRVEAPPGLEFSVVAGAYAQRLIVPGLAPQELRPTGDDETFFERAEALGVRVLRGLGAWQPGAAAQDSREDVDLTWLAAALGVLLLLAALWRR